MRKQPAKDGVGQLVLQIVFPEGRTSHGTEETQENGPEASSAPPAARSQPERKRKWYSLIDKVYTLSNLQQAWQQVAANGGAPGSDGMTIEKFGATADQRLEQLAADLRAKTYRPQPVRRVFIPKAGGGQRPLGIPSVVDRAVKHGYQWVVDADLQAFFDTVDHRKLIAALNEEIADGSVLNLVTRILKAGVFLPETASVEPTELGTPQGGPLSPLLANVYWHHFDTRMVQAGYGLVRYADDFVLFAKSEDEAVAALTLARQVLEEELGLRLHPEKTRVVSVAHGFEFLGFHYFRDPKTDQLRKAVRAKSARRFREAIRARTPRLKNQRKPKARRLTPARLAKNQALRRMIADLNRFLRGWHWYFKAVWSPYATPFRNFDGFVRGRVRAAITGRVGPGWWNKRLPNALLRELGLIPSEEWHREYLSGQLAAPARKG